MTVDVHSERFVLNECGLYSCQEVLSRNENNTDSDLSRLDDYKLLSKAKNSMMLKFFFIEPFKVEKTCHITKRELSLDFSYFCILMKELLDSKVFRYGFIQRWGCSNERSLAQINNCSATATESLNQNRSSRISDLKDQVTKIDNRPSEVVQQDLLVNLSKEGNRNHYQDDEISILMTNSNPVDEKFFLTNQHASSLPTITLHISGSVPVFLDKRWCGMLHQSVQERIQLDVSMSWLSTLGGACSALGDYSPDWASKAALISSQQMKLAVRIGDPHVLARCRLYAAIAFIQKGNFKAASTIIQREYDALRCQPVELRDRRLAKMCQGIWVKLLYTKKFGRLT